MYKECSDYIYSPSDLNAFLENECVTWLDRYELEFPGEIKQDEPTEEDELFRKSGEELETRVLDSFRSDTEVAIIDRSERAFQKTIAAMRQGCQVIYQARLTLEPFAGWSDFFDPRARPFGIWGLALRSMGHQTCTRNEAIFRNPTLLLFRNAGSAAGPPA